MSSEADASPQGKLHNSNSNNYSYYSSSSYSPPPAKSNGREAEVEEEGEAGSGGGGGSGDELFDSASGRALVMGLAKVCDAVNLITPESQAIDLQATIEARLAATTTSSSSPAPASKAFKEEREREEEGEEEEEGHDDGDEVGEAESDVENGEEQGLDVSTDSYYDVTRKSSENEYYDVVRKSSESSYRPRDAVDRRRKGEEALHSGVKREEEEEEEEEDEEEEEAEEDGDADDESDDFSGDLYNSDWWEDHDDLGYVKIELSDDVIDTLREKTRKWREFKENLARNAKAWEEAVEKEGDLRADDVDVLTEKFAKASIDKKPVSYVDLASGYFGKLLGADAPRALQRPAAVDLSDYDSDSSDSDVADYGDKRVRSSFIRGQEPFPSLPRSHLPRNSPHSPRSAGSMADLNYSYTYFNLKVVMDPYRTGFEDSKEFQAENGTIVAGRYEIQSLLGGAAFSNAYMCADLLVDDDHPHSRVCLKVIKNNKDYFDQSIDEIKLLQYINTNGDADRFNFVRMIDYFYYKEHLIIVSELLKENLYDFATYVENNQMEPYFTLPRLKKIGRQVLDALEYIHSLGLIHCDLKPENIVIKSFSRCEVKLIDFGSSCFRSDPLSTYIQSRSYRAPEVILGHEVYDGRIDIWSLGAVLAEMYTGYVLFQNDSVPTMLSRIIAILGPFPKRFLSRCRDTHKYFLDDGTPYQEGETEDKKQLLIPKRTTLGHRLGLKEYDLRLGYPALQSKSRHRSRRSSGREIWPDMKGEFSDEYLFIDFVDNLLRLDPYRRPTAELAIQHPFLDGALDIDFSIMNSVYSINQAQQEPDEYDDEEDEEGEEEEEEEEGFYDAAEGLTEEDFAGQGLSPEDFKEHYERFVNGGLNNELEDDMEIVHRHLQKMAELAAADEERVHEAFPDHGDGEEEEGGDVQSQEETASESNSVNDVDD